MKTKTGRPSTTPRKPAGPPPPPTPRATWLIQCCSASMLSTECTLTVVPQATGICPVCKQSIFRDRQTGRDHRQ